LLEPEQKGLISTISVINDEDAFGFSIESSDEDRAKESVSFLGYAHIKNGKLYEYLTPEISRGANILQNNLKTAPITIEDDEGNKINLDVQRVVTDYSFEFEGDDLKKVYIKSRIRSNFSHITNILNIYEDNTIGEYEKKQAEVLVNEISGVMNKMKETNSDFINLLQSLKMKHPYKYQKIKDKWTEILPNLEYEVYVDSQISRTYDVFDRLIKGED
jgi:spore germination protein KC